MTRMTGPDCAVMRNLINIHTYVLGFNKFSILRDVNPCFVLYHTSRSTIVVVLSSTFTLVV